MSDGDRLSPEVVRVAIVVVTLLAAMAGGKQGTHYHRTIDRTGV